MSELIPVLTKDAIARKVNDIARKISFDYKDRELIIVGVLKGSFIFVSDLVRQLTIPVKIDFISASSYGSSTSSSGNIRLTKEIDIDLKNKDVLIVDDIIDTGLTLSYLVEYVKSFAPKSVKVCILLDKIERRKVEFHADYVCYAVPKGFLVGYGLDYAENYRNLPEICHLKL